MAAPIMVKKKRGRALLSNQVAFLSNPNQNKYRSKFFIIRKLKFLFTESFKGQAK